MPKVIGPLWEPKSQYWLKIEVGDDGIVTRYKAIPKEVPNQDQVGIWEPLYASHIPLKPDWLVWDSSERKIIHHRFKDKKIMRRFASKIGMRFEHYIDGSWQPCNAKDFGQNTDPLPTEKEIQVPADPKFAEALTWEDEREKDLVDVGLDINTRLHGTQQKAIIGAIDTPLELLKQSTIDRVEYIRALGFILEQRDDLPCLGDVVVEHIKEFRVYYLSEIRIDSCKINASNQVGQKVTLGDVFDFILNRIVLEFNFYEPRITWSLPPIDRNGVWGKDVGEAFEENSGFSVNGNMHPYIQERYELMKKALKNGIDGNSLEELKILKRFIDDFSFFDEPGFGNFSAETSSIYKLLESAFGSADNFWALYWKLKENATKRIEELDKQQTALIAEQKVQEWIDGGKLDVETQEAFDELEPGWKRRLTTEPLCSLISNGSVEISEAVIPFESLIYIDARTAIGYVDYLLNKSFVSEEQFSLIVVAALIFEDVMHKVLDGRLYKWLKMTPKRLLAQKYWKAADRLLDDEGLSPEDRYIIIGQYITSTTPELSHKLITKICNNSSLLSRLTPIEKIPVYTEIERLVHDGHKEFRATLEEIRSGSEAELIIPLWVDLDILIIELQIFSQESTTDAQILKYIFKDSTLSHFILCAFIHHESLIKNIRPATKIIIYDRIYKLAQAGYTHAKRAFDKIKDDWLIKLCPLDSKTVEHLNALGARRDDGVFWMYMPSHDVGPTFFLPHVVPKNLAVAVAFYLDIDLHHWDGTSSYNVITGHEAIALHYFSNLKADDLFKGRNAKLVNAIALKYLSVAKKLYASTLFSILHPSVGADLAIKHPWIMEQMLESELDDGKKHLSKLSDEALNKLFTHYSDSVKGIASVAGYANIMKRLPFATQLYVFDKIKAMSLEEQLETFHALPLIKESLLYRLIPTNGLSRVNQGEEISLSLEKLKSVFRKYIDGNIPEIEGTVVRASMALFINLCREDLFGALELYLYPARLGDLSKGLIPVIRDDVICNFEPIALLYIEFVLSQKYNKKYWGEHYTPALACKAHKSVTVKVCEDADTFSQLTPSLKWQFAERAERLKELATIYPDLLLYMVEREHSVPDLLLYLVERQHSIEELIKSIIDILSKGVVHLKSIEEGSVGENSDPQNHYYERITEKVVAQITPTKYEIQLARAVFKSSYLFYMLKPDYQVYIGAINKSFVEKIDAESQFLEAQDMMEKATTAAKELSEALQEKSLLNSDIDDLDSDFVKLLWSKIYPAQINSSQIAANFWQRYTTGIKPTDNSSASEQKLEEGASLDR